MVNEMRDRLADLLKKADKNCERKCITDYEDAILDNADYLIENGFLCPPCKVGDIVYSFCETFGVVLPYFIESLHIAYLDKNITVYQYDANSTNIEQDELLDSIDFEFDDIGKTVFLTKAEAEQKLQDLVGDDK